MPNHVHLILVPSDADGLRRALAAVHWRYAGILHARRMRTGHFWQGRFGAAVMDEAHLAAALRYVSLNPVRERFPRFADLLDDVPKADLFDRLCAAESIGRPLGDDRFLARIERLTARAASRQARPEAEGGSGRETGRRGQLNALSA